MKKEEEIQIDGKNRVLPRPSVSARKFGRQTMFDTFCKNSRKLQFWISLEPISIVLPFYCHSGINFKGCGQHEQLFEENFVANECRYMKCHIHKG
jgi:hypothetical protein